MELTFHLEKLMLKNLEPRGNGSAMSAIAKVIGCSRDSVHRIIKTQF